MTTLLKNIILIAGLSFAATASAATLTAVKPSIVAGADVYNATYVSGSGSQPITIFCLDYINGFTSGATFNVNASIDTSLAAITNTRYGLSSGSFATNTITVSSVNYSLGDAQNRYLLAGYLASQYGANSTTNTSIQDAIWELLAVTGQAAPPSNSGSNAQIASAINWKNGQSASQLTAFENSFKILSDTAIAGVTGAARYSTGNQEFLSFGAANATPEPSTFALLGGGLALVGLARRRMRN